MAYSPTTWNTNDVITKDKLNKIEQGINTASKLSGTDIDTDKDWNGKNITNLGKISPKTWLIVTGADPLLISKSHDSSTTVTFAQLDGTGHVKVVVVGASVNYAPGTRTFTILKNGSQIWTESQSPYWDGERDVYAEFTKTAFEDLSIASGDTLTLSRTGGDGAVTLKIYSTPLVAPYGIVS
ncbi:MAG: hypothetical protein BWY06_03406 [Candidatus Latescibacteria bacterium ADurb.Bin168]|nr:MAG: hypothetical protein BWY06_03406 [Candidatus Latescibacteria bacterium ADurb.Bin168]